MDSDPAYWLTSNEQRALRGRLMSYFACVDDAQDGPYADQVACNFLVGKVVQDLHGYSDFARAGGGWLTANEIATKVEASASWRALGSATSQSALDAAASAASNGDAVIAVRSGSPGHVALILPGATRRSGTWALDVPNSASFSLNRVENAYAFCRLSYAFSSPTGVELYAR